MGDTDDRLTLTQTDRAIFGIFKDRVGNGAEGTHLKRGGNKHNHSHSELERSKITWRSLDYARLAYR